MKLKNVCLSLLAVWCMLVAAPLWAQAQPPSCWFTDAAAKSFTLTIMPNSLAELLDDKSKAAVVATWFCDAKYGWKKEGFWFYPGNGTPEQVAEAKTYDTMTRDQRIALFVKNLKCPMGDTRPECDYLDPLEAIARQQFISTAPTPILWRVRDNPTSTTRPVFPVVNGVRSTTASTERVSDSATCGCTSLAIEESGGTYCSVTGLPNAAVAGATIPASRVALCYRAN